MGSAGGDRDARLPHHDPPEPVDDRAAAEPELGHRLSAEPVEHRHSDRLMGFVVEAARGHVGRDAARRSQKEDVAAGSGGGHRREDGRAVDRPINEPARPGVGGWTRRGDGGR